MVFPYLSVDDVTRIPDMVRQALRTATTGRPGPVHLQFQGNEGFIDTEEADFPDHDLVAEADYGRVPPYRPRPDPDRVRAAVERIARARRPVIVAGGGVRASAAGGALRAFAEALQVPLATSLNGRDAVPDTHPLSVGVVGTYSRKTANRVVSEADLVVFIGTVTGGMTTHFWRVPAMGTAVVHIDIDAEALGRNYPAEVAVLGDARVTLEEMLRAERPPPAEGRDAWLARTQAIRREWREEMAPLLGSEALPMRPERLCADLSRLMPDDALVVVDTGHAGMWMGGMFDLTSPGQGYIRCMGHLGWAFPAGLGVKCAAPERPVVTFTGDLGFWYHIAEVETAVRWNINTVTIVNNNHSGNQSTMGFFRAYQGQPTEQSRELWVHNEVNFARIADEIGALGIRVETPRELEGAVARALEAGRPAVIDVVTDIEALAPVPWEPTEQPDGR